MKIDTHQHFWMYDPEKHSWIDDNMAILKRNFLPIQVKRDMEKNGFTASVGIQAVQSEEETLFLLRLAEQYRFIKGVVGWIDLQADNLEDRLHFFSKYPLLKGFRHIVQDELEDDFLLRSSFLRGIEKLTKYDYTYDILVYSRQLSSAIEFVSHFPRQKFVLDHMGKPSIRDEGIKLWSHQIELLSQYENVYCKLSGMVTEASWEDWHEDDFKRYLEVVCDAFGADRLMVGSDWPVCKVAATYSEVMSIVDHHIDDFSEEEKRKILGANARYFYSLKI